MGGFIPLRFRAEVFGLGELMSFMSIIGIGYVTLLVVGGICWIFEKLFDWLDKKEKGL